ncbi:MAG: DUF6168 family protein [Flavobacteriaceae bacterium]|nr:DUF6168 family protein [Flavobacteriaceae bacterium]
MNNPLKYFIILLTVCVTVIFGLHILYLHFNHLPLFDHKIIPAYIMNYGLALGVYILLYSFRIKLKTQLGFLFIAGSFLKFILFFLFFYSSYKADGDISTLEFSSFFLPYAVCLIIETAALVKLLKNLT